MCGSTKELPPELWTSKSFMKLLWIRWPSWTEVSQVRLSCQDGGVRNGGDIRAVVAGSVVGKAPVAASGLFVEWGKCILSTTKWLFSSLLDRRTRPTTSGGRHDTREMAPDCQQKCLMRLFASLRLSISLSLSSSLSLYLSLWCLWTKRISRSTA